MDRMAAASGQLLSGKQAQGLTQYAGNLANQTYGQYLNALQSTAGTGQSAAGSLGSLGMGAASNIGNANIAAGDARASGYTGMTNALGQGLGDLGSYWGYQNAQNNAVGTSLDNAFAANPGLW